MYIYIYIYVYTHTYTHTHWTAFCTTRQPCWSVDRVRTFGSRSSSRAFLGRTKHISIFRFFLTSQFVILYVSFLLFFFLGPSGAGLQAGPSSGGPSTFRFLGFSIIFIFSLYILNHLLPWEDQEQFWLKGIRT